MPQWFLDELLKIKSFVFYLLISFLYLCGMIIFKYSINSYEEMNELIVTTLNDGKYFNFILEMVGIEGLILTFTLPLLCFFSLYFIVEVLWHVFYLTFVKNAISQKVNLHEERDDGVTPVVTENQEMILANIRGQVRFSLYLLFFFVSLIVLYSMHFEVSKIWIYVGFTALIGIIMGVFYKAKELYITYYFRLATSFKTKFETVSFFNFLKK